jgi:hypothetical protein
MADDGEITDGYQTNPDSGDEEGRHIDIFVTFACKDPMVAKYYRNRFGTALRHDLRTVVEDLIARMTAEATEQEHWDYDVIDGRRIPRRDEDGTAQLLTPKVKVAIMINGRRDNDRDV